MPCFHNPALRDILRLNGNIQHVAVYGEKDGRQTEEEYAASHNLTPALVKSQYAASGQLNCNGILGEAQLTVKDNIITTASHLLQDIDTCRETSKPDQCKFIYKLKGREFTIPVETLIAQGFRCPHRHEPELDWAVMKLKSPATGVTPYRLPTFAEMSVKEGQKVVAVATMSIDFQKKDPLSGKTIYPRHIEDCQIRDIYGGVLRALYGNDCSGSQGRSGGSILTPNTDSPALLAIVSYNMEPEEKALKAQKSGVPNKAMYEEGKWQDFAVPVHGVFLNAILKATE